MTTQSFIMVRKDGKYYFAPHRRFWGVWLYHESENGGGYGEFIQDFKTKEDAKSFVYNKNGYNK